MEKKSIILKGILLIVLIIIVGIIFAKGKEAEMFEIEESEFIQNIENKVEIDEIEKIKVYVTGEVYSPGVFELEYGDRIEDAINLAGGVTENANLKNINLAYALEDGEKLYIPNINENDFNEENFFAEQKNNSKININKSGIEQLITLPGVGNSLAQKIISYREENGKFKRIEDLKNVSGIGDKKYESLKELITI